MFFCYFSSLRVSFYMKLDWFYVMFYSYIFVFLSLDELMLLESLEFEFLVSRVVCSSLMRFLNWKSFPQMFFLISLKFICFLDAFSVIPMVDYAESLETFPSVSLKPEFGLFSRIYELCLS
jgi:hypothetical protein